MWLISFDLFEILEELACRFGIPLHLSVFIFNLNSLLECFKSEFKEGSLILLFWAEKFFSSPLLTELYRRDNSRFWNPLISWESFWGFLGLYFLLLLLDIKEFSSPRWLFKSICLQLDIPVCCDSVPIKNLLIRSDIKILENCCLRNNWNYAVITLMNKIKGQGHTWLALIFHLYV